MQPSRNTQWNRIRLTQTAQEAGVLTSGGSGSTRGCCGTCLLWGGNSFNKLGLCPENTNASPPPGLQRQGLLCCGPFRTVSSTPLPNASDKFRQVQLNHSRWAKRSGPWNFVSLLPKATGKHSMPLREQAGFLPHKSSIVSAYVTPLN